MIILQDSIKPLGLSPTETQGSGQFVNTKLPYQVLGERMEFWEDDDVSQFYAYFQLPNTPAVSTVIKLMNDEGHLLDKLVLPYSQTTNRFSFKINMKDLSYGAFAASVGFLNHTMDGSGEVKLTGEATVYFAPKFRFTTDGGSKRAGAAGCRIIPKVKLRFTGGGWLKLKGAAACRIIPKAKFRFTGGGWTKLKGIAGARIQ